MKLILSVAIVFGLVASLDSACDVTTCIEKTACDEYQEQHDCLTALLPDCTPSDAAAKAAIDVAITATEVKIALCGGATSVSVSMVTLVLAAAAVYFKS